MSEIKKQSTIKDMIMATIEEHIDAQNEKGMKKYGESIDDCPVDAYDWQHEVIQELIDALNYQQKEIGRLNDRLTGDKDSTGDARKTSVNAVYSADRTVDEQTPYESLKSVIEDYKGISERDEIIEDLEDEIEGLKKELESSRGEYLHLRILANNAAAESKKLRDLLIHAWGEN